jgi:hypothetical protein
MISGPTRIRAEVEHANPPFRVNDDDDANSVVAIL